VDGLGVIAVPIIDSRRRRDERTANTTDTIMNAMTAARRRPSTTGTALKTEAEGSRGPFTL